MSGEYISVSNGKRLVSNVKKRAKMFAVCAWMQIAVGQYFSFYTNFNRITQTKAGKNIYFFE
jgi:hypothetical protein